MQRASTHATNTREKLLAILVEYAQQVSERRSPLFSLRRIPDKVEYEQVRKQHGRLVQQMLAPLEKTLQEAVAVGELRRLPEGYSLASLLLGLFHGMLQHKKHCAIDQIKENDIELVIDIFWNGVKKHGEST
jgi:hypothetical protein